MKKTTLALCLTLAATLSFAQKKSAPLYRAALGVQSYTFRNTFPKGILATLDTIKALGFTELEGSAPRGMTPPDFRRACNERGITIPSTGGSYEQLVANPQEAADNAKALGASYVMCAWIPHQKGNFTLANAQKAVADFNAIGKVMHDNGLTFCYHDHGYEFQPYGDGTLLDYLIQHTDPRYVSFEMDVLWTLHGGGDPVALLRKYGSRWKLMHMKDLKKGVKGDLTGGTPPANDVVVGEGQADFVGILHEANKIGIRHFFIEDESDNEFEQMPKSIAFLKNLRQ